MRPSTSPQPPLFPLTWIDAGLAGFVFLAMLGLYVRTLAPTLVQADSAEFQTLAYTLGMAHSPGKPLYLLLAKFFTLIPRENIAYRVNLLSAVSGAATLALLFLGGRTLAGRRIAALAGPLGLGVCSLFWWQSIMAEVYTPATAMLAGVFLLLFLWRRSGRSLYLFAAGLLGGSGLGVHNTVLLGGPAVLVYLLLTTRRRRDWAAAAGGAVGGLALTIAAFLFLDARSGPSSYYQATILPWLSHFGLYPDGFDTPLERMVFMLLSREYYFAAFQSPLSGILPALGQYFSWLGSGWSAGALALMAAGALAAPLLRRLGKPAPWRELLALILAWATLLAFIINYTIIDIYTFYLPSYIPLALLASTGAALALDGLEGLAQRFQPRLFENGATPQVRALGLLLALAATLAAVIGPAVPTLLNSIQAGHITFWADTDYALYPYPVLTPYKPYEHAEKVVNRLEDDAILFADWGRVFTFTYVAHVDQGRTGIAIHQWYRQPSGAPADELSVRRYLDDNLGLRSIYFTGIPYELVSKYRFVRVLTTPSLYRLEKK